MQGETQKALARDIGSPTQWKKMNVWEVAKKTAEAPGTRVVFGEALANNEKFVAGISEYVANVTVYGFALRYISIGPLRDFILYLVHWRHRRSLPAVLTPLNNVIMERKRMQSTRHSEDDESFDCIQWALDQALPDESKTAEAIARRLVVISIGTIETVAGTLAKLLIQLASHPECHEEIRAEVRECLAEDNHGWTLKATGQMKKLESVIQESFRVSAGAVSSKHLLAPCPILTCALCLNRRPIQQCPGSAWSPAQDFGLTTTPSSPKTPLSHSRRVVSSATRISSPTPRISIRSGSARSKRTRRMLGRVQTGVSRSGPSHMHYLHLINHLYRC
jgi:hypothetical protein